MRRCFFIGHREAPDRVFPNLLETIERHITEYGVSEFVVGQYGNFDHLAIRALSQAKREHPDITLMLMTPYYPVNKRVKLPEEFDALFYPPNLETVPRPCLKNAKTPTVRPFCRRASVILPFIKQGLNGLPSSMQTDIWWSAVIF